MDDTIDATGPGPAVGQMVSALVEASRKVGAEVWDDAVFDGLQAAALAFTGVFKGYLANGVIDRATYDLVVATAAGLLRAGEVQRRR